MSEQNDNKDLISRQVLLDAIFNDWDGMVVSLPTLINSIPSAQKKGHWVENHDSDHAWKCSECGCGYTDSKLSFCYDCGADMRKS